MPDWTAGDVAALLGNPFYAINIDPSLAEPHEPLISEEQWIAANIRAIEESGSEVGLSPQPVEHSQAQLLDAGARRWHATPSDAWPQ